MLRKLIASAVAMITMSSAFSQDSSEHPALSINGSADVYYKYDLAKTKANNYTSFTNSHNSFELGMATVKLDYKTSKVEMVADLGFGKRAQDFSYNDAGILQAVKQLYLSYSPADWLKLTAGSWATHVGYELVDANLNRNYSMSYMFTNGPFFHTGVKAELSMHGNGLMIGVANPTDFKYVPDGVVNKKFLIAQYSYTKSENFKAFVNYVGGENIDTSKSKQLDLVLTTKISSKFSLGANGTVTNVKSYMGNKKYDENKKWWGSALYVNFDPTSVFGLTLREEYFSDKSGLKIPGLYLNGNIFASTLSANFRVDNFIFIPEFRIDHSNKSIFTKKDGTGTTSAANVLLAAVYQF
ncbi:MAG TPA: outer membrane beta-barrel protein [Flavisolibacter sp.]|nr:outer membrane beta-barrel protein [Flavisolibacter sp.]